jgi:hypothetical protein
MDNRVLFPAEIIDIEDPLGLNRVRARVDSDRNDDILNSISNPNFNEKTDIWGDRDPFIFKPLLPYYINAPLSAGERILVIYANKDFKFDNQYYIQSDFNSPMRADSNTVTESRILTGSGRRFKRTLTLKNLDGSYRKSKVKGIFVEPNDTGIIGRGSSDILVKEDDVIIRAGKYKGSMNPNEFPTPNYNRSFVQVSQFKSRKVKNPPEVIELEREKTLGTKFLIEWVIQNPDATNDKFDGFINLYNLIQNERVAIKNLDINSTIDDLKIFRCRVKFNQLSKENTIKFINDFIQKCNSGVKLDDGTQLFFENEIKFPIFFRPGYSTYLRLSGTFLSKTPSTNVIDIYNEIKFDKFSNKRGSGFIYSKDSTIVPTFTESGVVIGNTIINEENSSALIGADTIYLLSHNTTPSPNKSKIDLTDTLYGIDNDKIVDSIDPNTSSIIRGEELLELINLIIRFLVTHAHPFPGEAPVSVTEDGSTIQNLLREFSLATTKILNKKIRIN